MSSVAASLTMYSVRRARRSSSAAVVGAPSARRPCVCCGAALGAAEQAVVHGPPAGRSGAGRLSAAAGAGLQLVTRPLCLDPASVTAVT